MYPFIHIGSWSLGTFGLFVWLAAVAAGILLHYCFVRDGVDADAMNVVVYVLIAGVIGSKLWHELQSPSELAAAMRHIFAPGMKHSGQVLAGLLEWLRAGFAWFGGLLAGIAMLLWQGREAKPNGLTGWRAGVRLLDLAAPAAAIGYGIGRIGCLTSGDGDYGKVTTSWIGVHLSPDALVPANPIHAAVLPTPLFEFAIAMVFGFVLWRLGNKARPLAWLTAVYLFLSGTARFCIEFYRINPKLYFGHTMSNAQVAALASAIVGLIILFAVRKNPPVGGRALAPQIEAVPSPS
jgi:phosphatidylglycerol:prolipoprotein diacylglycerol transferase